MSTTDTEASPLLSTVSAPPAPEARPKAARTVTFNADPVSRTIEPEPDVVRPRTSHYATGSGSAFSSGHQSYGASTGNMAAGPPMLAALNNRLRRRNSHGGTMPSLPPLPAPKIGPQRSTKNAQKLKLLPNPEFGDEGPDEESGRDVYSQYTRIKDPTARRDAARLGKADRDRLPRVTAYCTANKYQMEGLVRFLKGRGKSKGANPKLIDECIYTPYSYSSKQVENVNSERLQEVHSYPAHPNERRHSTGEVDSRYHQQDLIDLRAEEQRTHELGGDNYFDPSSSQPDLLNQGMGEESAVQDLVEFDIHVHTPEIFLFDYGVVVIWGMSLKDEQRFLKEIAKFELEKLAADDVETEFFNFYYTREYQPRIYNDFITLREKSNYMTKLAISHALAQSVKTSLFEELIASTIDTCKDIPTQIALTGKIALSRTQINMQIGELFILRINIHLNGSVLDTPELFWVEPQLEPVYQAVRSYLEMDQRVGLLTERLDVIADLLAVLKDQLSHGHGEKLEWIVIILIAAEILVAAVNIVVDLYAGVD
ncbi:putative sporulation protein rmd1 protein [Phaeoacremonium minimum UCRPA7]|uniref:Putative sporulation protein rmd1 protein n=1 Tax=Phaeoacremonium minimum (strain UCR-PA7) TaxID=1286976 RepID=R8BTS8_PHAM7|nr:putative sporulation protein rmd1 protein [Phaeoacremonium minimum UCRPA7]EOO02771.1 putative sporulation protein rmd1 protein [Phaeoacremonium minimum UCRPA7]